MFVTYKEYLGSFTAYMYILNIDKYNIYIYIYTCRCEQYLLSSKYMDYEYVSLTFTGIFTFCVNKT